MEVLSNKNNLLWYGVSIIDFYIETWGGKKLRTLVDKTRSLK